jgi:hypothetical protein
MKEFRFCLRHYYWRRYGSWGGSRSDAPHEARQAYVLKYLTHLWSYVGTVVHRTCARFWRDYQKGQWLHQDTARRDTIRALYAGIGESRRGGWRQRVSSGTHLFEHEYGCDLSEERIGQARHRIVRSLAGFYALDLVQNARKDSVEVPEVLCVERRERFVLADVTVHLVMDLVVQAPDGGRVIWDWKSGEEREVDEFQGAVYALYAQQSWGLPIRSLSMSIAYLRPQMTRQVLLTTESIARTRAHIAASISAMRARLQDVKENVARIDDFHMTDELVRCSRCAFKRLCARA